MKKAIEVKTVMFALQDRDTIATQPLHTEQSPSSFHRTDTSPSQRRFKGSKIVHKVPSSKGQRRFSQHCPKNSRSPGRQDRQKAQPESRGGRSRGMRGLGRYEQTAGEERMVHSYSNMRLGSLNQSRVKNGPVLRPAFEQSRTSMNWAEMMESRKDRIKSEPNPANLKQEMLLRVSKKVEFMKKMTLEVPDLEKGQGSPEVPSKLFNFDRLYEHCLKKITKSINCYEKDLGRTRDSRYHQLKVEGSILTQELQSMRRHVARRKDSQEGNLGVIGSVMEVGRGERERVGTQRGGSRGNACLRKKLEKMTRNLGKLEGRNPFAGPELHGWDIRCEKGFDFEI